MASRQVGSVRGRLLIRNGGFEGMVYELCAEETLIGRNPTTDITLLDEGISREHALILWDETHQVQERGTNHVEVAPADGLAATSADV